MPFCPNCGRKLAENETCNCQNNQNNNTASQQNIDNNVSTKKNKKTILVIVIVAVILLIFIIGIIAGYVITSKTSKINNDTKNIFNSVNAAISGISESGGDLSGTYIICSDPSENRAVGTSGNSFDTSTIYRSIEQNFNSISRYDWFAVIENGVVTYCAAENKADDDFVGTYPTPSDLKQGPATYGGGYAGREADLDDLYEGIFYYLG